MFVFPVTHHQHQQQRQLSRLIEGSLDHFFGNAASAESTARSPALDVAESDTNYTVTLDLPGVAKEDVKVAVEGRVVSITAEPVGATEDASSAGDETKPAADRVIYRERAARRFARRFSLPVEVNQAQAGAKLEHGVLTLTLPKRVANGAAQITIN
jgi:HSP20 family protein